MDHYILEGRETKPVDTMTWARWFGTADRKIKRETIGASDVSTVFLGLNHSCRENEPPMLFETMVFGGPLDQEYERCTTYEQAEFMHKTMCERVRNES